MRFVPLLAAASAALCTFSASAGLIGTDLTLSALQQASPGTTVFESSFPRVARVLSDQVEFPDVASLFNPNDPKPPGFGSLVNTWIDAGNDFIEIDFFQAGSGTFASGHQNTYVFQFDSAALATIVGASIDDSVTTLGLDDTDVRFEGNRLFVNVESLSFTPSSFARIHLDVVGGPQPVPEPAGLPLVVLGGAAALAVRRRVGAVS